MTFELDRSSLLVRVPGAATIASIERTLAGAQLTLGLDAGVLAENGDDTVAAWLARGAPGAPSSFADPVDHLVAGLTATLVTNQGSKHGASSVLEIHPAPRRAVGPDLMALCIGARDRFASIDHVWLRVHALVASRVALAVDAFDLDPPLSVEETNLLDAIARELALITPT